jgi:hypothetical protein
VPGTKPTDVVEAVEQADTQRAESETKVSESGAETKGDKDA